MVVSYVALGSKEIMTCLKNVLFAFKIRDKPVFGNNASVLLSVTMKFSLLFCRFSYENKIKGCLLYSITFDLLEGIAYNKLLEFLRKENSITCNNDFATVILLNT